MMMIGRALPPEGDIFCYTLKKRLHVYFHTLGNTCAIYCSALVAAIGDILLDTLFDTLDTTCSITSMTPCSIPWAILVRYPVPVCHLVG